MKLRAVFALIGALLMLVAPTFAQEGNPEGCVENYDPNIDYFPDKAEVVHAQGFTVEYFNHYKVVETLTTIATTHAGTDADIESNRYVLVQCGTPDPELTDDLAGATIIEIPISTAVDGDDVLFESFELLGAAEGLLGVGSGDLTEVEAPYLPTLFERQQTGDLTIVGYEINLETLALLEPDIYIKSSGDTEVFKEIEQTLGIPVVIYNPYQEGPLGGAEKVKFLSLFYNREQIANEHLAPVFTRYQELQGMAAQQTGSPRVLVGFIRPDGSWSTRQNERYENLLIRDAGGEIVFDLPGNGFATLDLEAAIDAGEEADFWFNLAWLPQQESAADYIETAEAYAGIPALVAGNGFHRFGLRGTDYAYNGSINPDLILADIISILYPHLLPDHELMFLERIPGL
jgi:iron complex transport system substrate-binding protein